MYLLRLRKEKIKWNKKLFCPLKERWDGYKILLNHVTNECLNTTGTLTRPFCVTKKYSPKETAYTASGHYFVGGLFSVWLDPITAPVCETTVEFLWSSRQINGKIHMLIAGPVKCVHQAGNTRKVHSIICLIGNYSPRRKKTKRAEFNPRRSVPFVLKSATLISNLS